MQLAVTSDKINLPSWVVMLTQPLIHVEGENKILHLGQKVLARRETIQLFTMLLCLGNSVFTRE